MDARTALTNRQSAIGNRQCRRRGLTIIEMLVALPIIALLMAATMVAINTSFMAYADAAEQASTHAATRMVTHRLLTLVRTSTAHGPLETEAGVTLEGSTITSPFIELIDTKGRLIRVEYRSASAEIWLVETVGETVNEQPLIGGVTSASFYLSRRLNEDDLWVLERGTMDITVLPDNDNTLAIESGHTEPIRMIASTMPRKIE